MGRLVDIQDSIQQASAALRLVERDLGKAPNDPGLVANAMALRHTREQLEREFKIAADSDGLDVCTYRVFSDHKYESVRGFANSLAHFQRLYSTVYDAIKNGPKQRNTLSRDVMEKTDFGFAYSSAGSVIATLTLPNERLLFDSDLDNAIDVLFALAIAKDANDVSAYVTKLGPGTVATLYEWALANADAQVGADVRWQRGAKTRQRLFMPTKDMAFLGEVLAQGGQPSAKERQLTGTLIGVNTGTGQFWFQIGDETLTGKLELESPFDMDHTVELPALYTAKIRTVTRDVYAKGEKEIRHVLVALRRRKGKGH